MKCCALGGAGLAERNIDPAAAVAGPVAPVGRADELEGHLDPLGVPGGRADFLDLPAVANSAGGGRVEGNGILAEIRVVPDQSRPGGIPSQVGTRRAQLIEAEAERKGLGSVDGDQGQDAAGDAAGCDCGQAGCRLLVELGGKVGDDEHAVGLGDFLGDRVVFFDRGVLVAEVFLRDGFHVRSQVGEPLLDLARVGPDLGGHEGSVIVCQVHERAEVAADADGVDDREANVARRQAGQEREHRCLKNLERGTTTLSGRFDQEVGVRRERAAERGS